MILNSPTISGSLTVTGNITASGSITLSGSVASASFATSASNATNAISASYANNLTVAGTLTAQTLVVQTITSSVLYSSGSNVFGNNIANTQIMTGSVNVTGSLSVVTNGTEFQVNATGVNLGNALTDSHVISGSVRINPNGLFVSSSGNVGIGTITPANKLTISNNGNAVIAFRINDTNANASFLSLNASNTDSAIIAGGTSAIPFDIYTSGSVRMSIAVSGLVTIQEGVRAQNYAVVRASSFRGGLYTYDAVAGSGTDYGITIFAEGGVNNGNIYFLPGGSTTKAMTVTTGGNVLIGTTTDSGNGRLVVEGLQGILLSSSGRGQRQIYFGTDGALVFYNTTNNASLSPAGVWTNASDISIKKDIKDIEYGLNEVMKLKPKFYKMIENNLEQIGFIAQDVEEILPELVSTSHRGMKGLSYGQITAVLTKAIQEQQSTITSLQSRIETLESK